MRRKTLGTLLMAGAMLGGASGCDLLGGGSDSLKLEIPTRFVERSAKGQSLSQGLGLLAPTPIQGLYFGELEIVAYDYRPGETLQTGQHFGWNTTQDWSYWVVLQSGHDAARDNLLQPGQQIDITAMNGDYNGDSAPEQTFVDQVGVFDIDLFEVYVHRTGVLYNNVYYGMNADLNGLSQHPLHKYPALASAEDHYCNPEYPGQPTYIQDENIFFVRSDWFPQTVIVNTRQDPTDSTKSLIEHSSLPLTTAQESLILSLVNNATKRRFYDNLLFIPYQGPASVKLETTATPSTPLGPHEYQAGNFQVTVSFNLTDIIAPDTDWSVPTVKYKGDANNVPFGLTVAFTQLAEAPETFIASGPASSTHATSATFDFGSNEPGVTYECGLDGGAYAACAPPATFSGLTTGSHTFQVRARNGAGKLDPTPASFSWTVTP